MARKATGSVIEPQGGRSWAIRFRAYGKRRYVALGSSEEGWSRQKAEAELRHVLADVERGTWRPYEPEPVAAPVEVPTFHVFASEWLESRKPELRPRSVADYEWCLSHHLLPFFEGFRLDTIDIAAVDAYKAQKIREGKLGAAQINKTLKALAMVIDAAIEYELTDRANPARGRKRRVKVPKARRTWVEPEQLLALLDASGPQCRPIVATLAGAGLRVGEALALDWRDINLATGTLTVGEAKTAAGTYREVDLPGGLIESLTEWKALRRVAGEDDPVFTTRTGRRQTVTNVDHRLKTAIRAANKRLEELGIEPISERVSPHSLRRTYASLRYACGDDPIYVAEQGGWADPAFPMKVYAKAVRRRDRLSGAYLEAFDMALDWAATGSGTLQTESSSDDDPRRQSHQIPAQSQIEAPRGGSSAG